MTPFRIGVTTNSRLAIKFILLCASFILFFFFAKTATMPLCLLLSLSTVQWLTYHVAAYFRITLLRGHIHNSHVCVLVCVLSLFGIIEEKARREQASCVCVQCIKGDITHVKI